MKGSTGQEFWIILIGGMLLSLNAGHLNGVTLLQEHPTTTTHMTGNSTNLGISIAFLNYQKMLFYASLIFFYVLGAFISGLMIPYQSFSVSLGYGKVLLLVSVLLSISAVIDIFHTSDFVFYDLCITCASGLQNGMVSRSDPPLVTFLLMTSRLDTAVIFSGLDMSLGSVQISE